MEFLGHRGRHPKPARRAEVEANERDLLLREFIRWSRYAFKRSDQKDRHCESRVISESSGIGAA